MRARSRRQAQGVSLWSAQGRTNLPLRTAVPHELSPDWKGRASMMLHTISRTSSFGREHRGVVAPGRWFAWSFTLLAMLGALLSGCGAASTGSGATPTATSGVEPVKVYFARHPETDNLPTAVFAVTRETTATTTHGRATMALQEIFKGPSQTERTQGYYSPFDGQLALQSSCPGAFRDFDLTLNVKGSTPEQGTATLQFCRRVDIPGDLDGPRMKAMLTSTLLQFPTITKVVILNTQGSCFDDLQGANACLSAAPNGDFV